MIKSIAAARSALEQHMTMFEQSQWVWMDGEMVPWREATVHVGRLNDDERAAVEERRLAAEQERDRAHAARDEARSTAEACCRRRSRPATSPREARSIQEGESAVRRGAASLPLRWRRR